MFRVYRNRNTITLIVREVEQLGRGIIILEDEAN